MCSVRFLCLLARWRLKRFSTTVKASCYILMGGSQLSAPLRGCALCERSARSLQFSGRFLPQQTRVRAELFSCCFDQRNPHAKPRCRQVRVGCGSESVPLLLLLSDFCFYFLTEKNVPAAGTYGVKIAVSGVIRGNA